VPLSQVKIFTILFRFHFSQSIFELGIRVGYAAMPSWLMNYMWRAKQPYNVSVVAEVAACAALDNPAYLKVCLKHKYTVILTPESRKSRIYS